MDCFTCNVQPEEIEPETIEQWLAREGAAIAEHNTQEAAEYRRSEIAWEHGERWQVLGTLWERGHGRELCPMMVDLV